ncbi:hypothetical protein [Flectobacillus longus]|uniref:hypothetical protein n=1 Tax=Flectobacillus longus TaxID=2984207 RepID=UPI0024B8315D|nr:hypothetical protein [Flectobacillus longus]MDI9880256.1 hypothetical protein [Flectobacillus longus]
MKNLKLHLTLSILLISIAQSIIAQTSSYQTDSIQRKRINKWIKRAQYQYPSDLNCQTVSVFTNLFWRDRRVSEAVSNGMSSIYKRTFMRSVHSFQGTFSFLISFDEKSEVKNIAFSENVPSEFTLVVQNNFIQTIEDISHLEHLKGAFKNKKVLLMLHLSWAFNNNPNIMGYDDDGTKSMKFKEEDLTLGEILFAESNFMARQF